MNTTTDEKPPSGMPLCTIHKRFAESFTNNSYWCDKCMDEIINPDGWYVYRATWGEYFLTDHLEDEWELMLGASPYRVARDKQLELMHADGMNDYEQHEHGRQTQGTRGRGV